MPDTPLVSAIIPARNAAATIEETLRSLQAQVFQSWEAIVIDDGSSDLTAAIVDRVRASDSRIRLERGPARGVSAARNVGIESARGSWLLFLDSDDLISPAHLHRMTAEIKARPDLDAVHCQWSYFGASSEEWGGFPPPQDPDLFELLATYCIFAIHACLVRRSVIVAVGGFDPALSVCEDWDLWQRIARCGARFGAVPETLARYRLHRSSCGKDIPRLYESGVRVIRRGHSADSRVSSALAPHAEGADKQGLETALAQFARWCVGFGIGSGAQLAPLVEQVGEIFFRSVDNGFGIGLFDGLRVGCDSAGRGTREDWVAILNETKRFLAMVESRPGASHLAGVAALRLECMAAEVVGAATPFTWGGVHAQRVEVTCPIPDIVVPAGVERLYCEVMLEGAKLGALHLPVCDGAVPATLLADQIAARFAWVILGKFFERTLYGRPPYDGSADVHAREGWTAFLRGLWGLPDSPADFFYDSIHPDPPSTATVRTEEVVSIELSHEIPCLLTADPKAEVVATLGGTGVVRFGISAEGGSVTAQRLRTELNRICGFELCVIAVREGILGRPFDATPLRERLCQAAQNAAPLAQACAPECAAIPRRTYAPVGTAVSRRAFFPTAVGDLVMQAASDEGLPVLQAETESSRPRRLSYSPGLILHPQAESPAPRMDRCGPAESRSFDRAFWEGFFATQEDPWEYTNSYEEVKYKQTLSLLPSAPIRSAMELACAEGHFTRRLAARAEHVLACDISEVALARAAARCAGLNNVEFRRLDLTREALPAEQDLIVCSEVLYYLRDMESLRAVAAGIAGALAPGGTLITAHARLASEEAEGTGFDWELPFGASVIGETLAATPGLELDTELSTPLYRIHSFRKQAAGSQPRPANRIAVEMANPLPPAIADMVCNHSRPPVAVSEKPRGDGQEVATGKIPILMYHRVAAEGAAQLARYRVDPRAFEAQIRYLAEAGYRGTSFSEWRQAAATRTPLPGRRVILTFDDAYGDFGAFAWPILRHYGFSAYVFAVTGLAGATSEWDAAIQRVPLLSWKDMEGLASQGVCFGSHSVTHPRLTMLPQPVLIRELLESRMELRRRLQPVEDTLAYPFGDTDEVVQHIAGACGYVYGVSVQDSLCGMEDSLLALPRIEIKGGDNLDAFIARLNGHPRPAGARSRQQSA